MLEPKSIIKLKNIWHKVQYGKIKDSTKTEIYRLRNARRNDSKIELFIRRYIVIQDSNICRDTRHTTK
jgi:hypothetical protein